ncbi:MAG: hypothetical protein IJV62_03160 [Eggerthellaceae bacterium]|nr:hypothetical protein [Eggerthellaceae bacterium]
MEHEEEILTMAEERYHNATSDLIIKGKKISTKEEAQEYVLAELKKKYGKDFTLVDDGEMGKAKISEDNVDWFTSYRVSFQDENGLEAQAVLQPDNTSGVMLYSGGGFDDTYSDTFYAKQAIEALEPILSGAPVDRYVVFPMLKNLAGGDLSLSLEEYFNKSIEGKYKVYVFVSKDLTQEERVAVFADVYERLTTQQEFPFGLEMHTDGHRIGSVSWHNLSNEYYRESLVVAKEAISGLDEGVTPDERLVAWDRGIGLHHPWIYHEYPSES